ncbi:precorrin-6A reductase [Streptococcus ovuberis]|uniref:Precorrin-6A reductase n=1 Tax=Streptococcus ovuberis TaxID=1936207 RepID=A0A7X6S1Q2_9STRE|nr:precorrin-6A reductase [Streptococcus ovuberis]NKZ20401.1 precorrin-6A reductase [Streptococcus ovuberis]
MMKLLLGGTSDSTDILALLNELELAVTTSVVTDYGKHLASKFGQPVIQGRLTAEDMVAFIQANGVDEIIDATHPFADIVSKEAIRAAELAGVSYVRFERQATLDLSGAIVVHSTEEAIQVMRQKGYKTVYLGTGSKTLPLFVEGLPDSRIVVRVLPTSEVLLACEQLGLVADQIDAIKAPFSKECNKELILRSKAEVFVSKESGSVGGIREKIDGCLELGIDCIIIARPLVDYPQSVSTVEELRAYLA